MTEEEIQKTTVAYLEVRIGELDDLNENLNLLVQEVSRNKEFLTRVANGLANLRSELFESGALIDEDEDGITSPFVPDEEPMTNEPTTCCFARPHFRTDHYFCPEHWDEMRQWFETVDSFCLPDDEFLEYGPV